MKPSVCAENWRQSCYPPGNCHILYQVTFEDDFPFFPQVGHVIVPCDSSIFPFNSNFQNVYILDSTPHPVTVTVSTRNIILFRRAIPIIINLYLPLLQEWGGIVYRSNLLFFYAIDSIDAPLTVTGTQLPPPPPSPTSVGGGGRSTVAPRRKSRVDLRGFLFRSRHESVVSEIWHEKKPLEVAWAVIISFIICFFHNFAWMTFGFMYAKTCGVPLSSIIHILLYIYILYPFIRKSFGRFLRTTIKDTDPTPVRLYQCSTRYQPPNWRA